MTFFLKLLTLDKIIVIQIKCNLIFLINIFSVFFQCYDTSSGLVSVDANDLSSTIPSGVSHGPPPSYETVVAMDQELDNCIKCASGNNGGHNSQITCPFMNLNELKSFETGNQPKNPVDWVTPSVQNNEQILNVCDMGRVRSPRQSCYCDETNLMNNQHYDLIKKCKGCGKEIQCEHSIDLQNNVRQTDQYCKCFVNQIYNFENNNNISKEAMQTSPTTVLPLLQFTNEINANNMEAIPSTSTTYQQQTNITTDNSVTDMNGNGNVNGNVNDNHNQINFETFNENGLIRMDMSQIIDQTGLPTYEAALKLESSGYV